MEPIGGADEVTHLDRVFRKMAEALARAEQRKMEFVTMISHDLRTPLTAIQGTLELCAKGAYGTLSERGRMRLEDAEKDSDRLISLINDLLDIERLEAGKMELVREDVELDPLIERAINCVSVLAEAKSVSIKATPASFMVHADSGRVAQILINLIGNAIKFSPDNSTVSIEQVGTAGSVEVRIRDEGPGIEPKFRDKIFDRFQQVDSDDHPGGSGLGLAICKAIVEAHGGEIGVDSEPGKGSTFWFRLCRVMDAR